MTIEKLLAEDLIRDEGVVLKPYKDHLGNLTFGIGRNVSARANWISEETAYQMLGEDVADALGDCLKVFPDYYTWSESRQRAIGNMMFQLGKTRFLKFKKMVDAIQKGDWLKASEEAKDSNLYRDPATRKRAMRVIKLMQEIRE
jgi:lysozyme